MIFSSEIREGICVFNGLRISLGSHGKEKKQSVPFAGIVKIDFDILFNSFIIYARYIILRFNFVNSNEVG